MPHDAALHEKLDLLLNRADGSAPYIFSEKEVAQIHRLLELRAQLDALGAESDAALIGAVQFALRLKTLGWFGRFVLWGLAAAAAVLSQWDKIMAVIK